MRSASFRFPHLSEKYPGLFDPAIDARRQVNAARLRGSYFSRPLCTHALIFYAEALLEMGWAHGLTIPVCLFGTPELLESSGNERVVRVLPYGNNGNQSARSQSNLEDNNINAADWHKFFTELPVVDQPNVSIQFSDIPTQDPRGSLVTADVHHRFMVRIGDQNMRRSPR